MCVAVSVWVRVAKRGTRLHSESPQRRAWRRRRAGPMQGLDLQLSTRRPYLPPPVTPEETFLSWWRIALTDSPSIRHLAPSLHVRRLVLDWYALR